MIGIVIVAHGGLALEYVTTVEGLLGWKTGIRAVSFSDQHDRLAKQKEICAAIEAVDAGAGVVIMTDLHGSSPTNLAMSACGCENRKILTGINMPMLIKLVKSRNLSLQNAIEAAKVAGRKYITSPVPTSS